MNKQEEKGCCVCCSCDDEHWDKMHLRSACEASVRELQRKLDEDLDKVSEKYAKLRI